jgi:hypothetical protein
MALPLSVIPGRAQREPGISIKSSGFSDVQLHIEVRRFAAPRK